MLLRYYYYYYYYCLAFLFFHSQSALLPTFIDCKERLLDLYSVVRLHLPSERRVLIIKLLDHFFFLFLNCCFIGWGL
jgi:hypothetical protein